MADILFQQIIWQIFAEVSFWPGILDDGDTAGDRVAVPALKGTPRGESVPPSQQGARLETAPPQPRPRTPPETHVSPPTLSPCLGQSLWDAHAITREGHRGTHSHGSKDTAPETPRNPREPTEKNTSFRVQLWQHSPSETHGLRASSGSWGEAGGGGRNHSPQRETQCHAKTPPPDSSKGNHRTADGQKSPRSSCHGSAVSKLN